jgi:hypothetical protein
LAAAAQVLKAKVVLAVILCLTLLHPMVVVVVVPKQALVQMAVRVVAQET